MWQTEKGSNNYFGATFATKRRLESFSGQFNASKRFKKMNGIIYLVGLVVVVMAILSFFGLH